MARKAHRLPREKRRHHRIAGQWRLTYEVDGHTHTTSVANLSLGGMFVQSARGLTVGSTHRFRLFLDEEGEPLVMRGRVLARVRGNRGGSHHARVQFEGQAKVFDRLRQFMLERVLPELEAELERTRRAPARAATLAELNAELGDWEDAIALYRQALEVNAASQALHERAVVFFLTAFENGTLEPVRALTEAQHAWNLGRELGSSAILDAAGEEIAAALGQVLEEARASQTALLRTQNEIDVRAQRQEERQAELEDERERIVEQMAMYMEHEADLAQQARAVEETQGELDDARRELSNDTDSLHTVRAELDRAETDLERQARELTEERRKLSIDQEELEAHAARVREQEQALGEEQTLFEQNRAMVAAEDGGPARLWLAVAAIAAVALVLAVLFASRGETQAPVAVTTPDVAVAGETLAAADVHAQEPALLAAPPEGTPPSRESEALVETEPALAPAEPTPRAEGAVPAPPTKPHEEISASAKPPTVSRAEVLAPADQPTAPHPEASAPVEPPPVSPGETSAPVDPVLTAEPEQHTVAAGETLSSIARARYGSLELWPILLAGNSSQLDDPDRLEIGTRLVVPALEGSAYELTRHDRELVAAGYAAASRYYEPISDERARDFARRAERALATE